MIMGGYNIMLAKRVSGFYHGLSMTNNSFFVDGANLDLSFNASTIRYTNRNGIYRREKAVKLNHDLQMQA